MATAGRTSDGSGTDPLDHLADRIGRMGAEIAAMTTTARLAAALVKVAAALGRARDVEDVTGAVLDETLAALGATAAELRVPTADGRRLELAAHRGPDAPLVAAAEDGAALASRAARTRQIEIASALDAGPVDLPWPRELLRRAGGQTVVAAPLEHHGALVGVLTFARATAGPLDGAERLLVEAVGQIFAVALRNAQVLASERRLAAQLEAVRRAALAITGRDELPTVLQTIADEARTLTAARHAAIVVAGEAAGGSPASQRSEGPEPLRVPLTFEGRRVGELHLTDKEGGAAFTAEDRRAVELLAPHAATTLDHANARERLRREAADQRATQQQLRESERRYQAIFHTTFQLMGLLTLEGHVLEANRALLELAGVDGGAALGRSFWELPCWRADEARTRLRDAIAQAARGWFVRYELDVHGRDGRVATIDFSLKPLAGDDGSIVALIAEGRDITERRRAEEERGRLLERERLALAQAELARARIEAVLNNVPVGVTFVDAASGKRMSNAVAIEILGGPATDEIADRLRRADGSPLGEQELPVTRALRGETVRAAELYYEKPSGGQVALAVQAAPVRDFCGAVVGAVLAFEDVTARKEFEGLRAEYVSLISHDLKNPLSQIGLYAELARRALVRHGGPDESKPAEVIVRQVRRIDAMIDDLLDTARVEAGRLVLRQEKTDAEAFVERVVRQSFSTADVRRIRIVAPKTAVPLYADQPRLERVVVNLVGNALKYSPAPSEVVVRIDAEDGSARLTIGDRGPGIEAQDLPHLFEKFYRAKKTRAEGVGLGLYISRLLVRAHGGDVLVASERGVGTTFTVVLPLLRRSRRPTPTAMAAVAAAMPAAMPAAMASTMPTPMPTTMPTPMPTSTTARAAPANQALVAR